MKAWQVHGSGEPTDVLRQVDRDVPDPGAEQVRIRVAATGLGLPDVLMCRGTYPLTPALPFTPGQELVGTVTAVGPGVDIAIGTRVLGVSDFISGNGSFAAETLAYASNVFPAPATMDDSTAAGFWIPNMTAWIGLVDRGGLEAGQRTAVLGAAGGSGIAAVQLGKARGRRYSPSSATRSGPNSAGHWAPTASSSRMAKSLLTEHPSHRRCAKRPTGPVST